MAPRGVQRDHAALRRYRPRDGRVVYLAVPPTSLPTSLPGHMTAPTTVAPPTTVAAGAHTPKPTMSPQFAATLKAEKTEADRQALMTYLAGIAQSRLLMPRPTPPSPRSRRREQWRYLLGTLAYRGVDRVGCVAPLGDAVVPDVPLNRRGAAVSAGWRLLSGFRRRVGRSGAAVRATLVVMLSTASAASNTTAIHARV